MKSVGEAMAIGRTFKEAFLKGVRSLELGKRGSLFPTGPDDAADEDEDETRAAQAAGGAERPADVGAVPRAATRLDVEKLHELTKIDPWFLQQFAEIVELRNMAALGEFRDMSPDLLRTLKRAGFGDAEIARGLRRRRGAACGSAGSSDGLVPAYKRIDTCAAEFESFTPYMYGTLRAGLRGGPDAEAEGRSSSAAAPTASGRASSSTTAAVTPSFGFRDEGFETVMINCNPETVSTDYDTADRLYFEPLTFEDVMAVIERERERRRRRRRASCSSAARRRSSWRCALQEAGVTILGTSPDSIDLAEDRQRFSQLLWDLGIPQPASGTATSRDEAREVAGEDRLPGRRPAVVRARRPRHGDRLRHRRRSIAT